MIPIHITEDNDVADAPLITSRFSFRRVDPKDAPLGSLVLFKPPSTERTKNPPNMAFGIITDGVEANEPTIRGILWLGAAYEFVPIDEVNICAVFGEPWQVVPELRRAAYRNPKPGDLMVSKAEGMGIVHAAAPGRWGLLSLHNAVATSWLAGRDAMVMPWSIVSGDEVIIPVENAVD
jgi:hypothetical protein